MDIFDSKNLDKLESQERYKMLDPNAILVDAGISEGLIGADLGCGTGFFTIPASELVGDSGQVYAFDIQREMLMYLRRRIIRPNVVPILIERVDTGGVPLVPLVDKLLDFVLLTFVLHELDDKRGFLTEVRRVLKAGGLVVVVEWILQEETMGPPIGVRLSQDYLFNLLEDLGFTVANPVLLNESNYIVTGIYK